MSGFEYDKATAERLVRRRGGVQSKPHVVRDRTKPQRAKAGKGLVAAEFEAKHGTAPAKDKVRGGKLRAKSGAVTSITGAEAAAIAANYLGAPAT